MPSTTMKKVIRFENEAGYGPYTSGIHARMNRRVESMIGLKPEPHEDGCKLKSISSYGGFCGFKDWPQLARWIEGNHLVVRAYFKLGMRIVTYEVPEDAYYPARSQVVFIKSRSTLVEEIHECSEELLRKIEDAYEESFSVEPEPELDYVQKEVKTTSSYGGAYGSCYKAAKVKPQRSWSGSSRFFS